MRKLLIALGVVALSLIAGAHAQSPLGPPNQILCNKQAIANVATATTTSLVNGVAGQNIFVCGWHVTSTQSTANTFTFESGTQGGPCGSPVAMTPNFVVTSTAPSSDHVDYAQMQVLPSGAQLCVVTTGATVGTAVLVWYNQF